MKETLELKHIAPYLPYNLQLQYIVRDVIEKIGTMRTLSFNDNETHPERVSIDYYDLEHIWMFKPILRRFKDITPEMAADFYHYKKPFSGFKIVRGIIKYYYKGDATWREIDLSNGFDTFEKVCKYHLDFNNLIEKGLAIDINTLA